LALRGGLFGETLFDWVLSGINDGGNLGVDIYLSGTVAAAREAAILGCQAAAFSHYRRSGSAIDWDRAARYVGQVFSEISSESSDGLGFWNINLPHLNGASDAAEMRRCRPCRHPLPTTYRRRGDSYHYAGRYAER